MKIPVDVAAILFYIIQPEYLFMVYKIFIDSSFGMIKQTYQYACCKTYCKTSYNKERVNLIPEQVPDGKFYVEIVH
jgi:hypothetical protein